MKSPPIRKRVALYARYSSDNQRSESIDAQVRAMTKYCEQNNYQIVEKYIDEAKSGTNSDKRPEFLQMISDSSKHLFDIVLVHKLDRFSRNRYDSAIYKNELKKNGVAVHSVLENLDSSPESIILEALLEGMSEYYSRNLAREVMKGMRENALQCKHTGGIPPLGFDVGEDRHLVINEQEAATVRLIFDLYSKGFSYDYIIAILNEKGLYTKAGKPFGKNSLYSILTNEKYNGVYVFNKSSSKDCRNKRNTHSYKNPDEIIRIPGGCPQIISDDVFQRVSNIIVVNREKAGRYKAISKYALSGFLRCGYCNRTMNGNRRYSGSTKTLLVTYRCFAHKDICNSNKEINQIYLEHYISTLLASHFGKRKSLESMFKKINRYITKNSSSIHAEIDASSKRLEEINRKIDNVIDMIQNGMSYEEVYSTMDELQIEKSNLLIKIERLTSTVEHIYDSSDIDQLLEQFNLYQDSPSSIDGRLFLSRVLDSIYVYHDYVEINLKTGLSISDTLDTHYTVSRKEIYALGKAYVKSERRAS